MTEAHRRMLQSDDTEQRIVEIEAWTKGGHFEVRDPDNFGGRCLDYLAWLTAMLRIALASLVSSPTPPEPHECSYRDELEAERLRHAASRESIDRGLETVRKLSDKVAASSSSPVPVEAPSEDTAMLSIALAALERIASPIRALQGDADKQGLKLDGRAAIELAHSPTYLSSTARTALNRIDALRSTPTEATHAK